MITNNKIINTIPFLKGKKILKIITLSKSFGMTAEKIYFKDKNCYIIKRFTKKTIKYNAIINEGKSLRYMHNVFPTIFPKVQYLSDKILVMNYIEHDDYKGSNYENELIYHITKIHKKKNNKYGFNFDTPIGGLKQPSKYSSNWIDFFKENRLGMIFKLINKKNYMPREINLDIENIINNLNNYIPNNPKPRLIHGDLWEGNILFHKGKLNGLIDPGIHFAHNEMEIAYLTWFKYVSKKFLDSYSEIIKIDNYYHKYEPIYQLYYCLLNVYLWSREYIYNTEQLIKKIKRV